MNTNKTQAEQLPQDAVMQSVFSPNIFRIGNFIKYKDNIKAIDFEDLKLFSQINSNVSDYKRFQITKDSLIDFGFKESNLDEDNSWLKLRYLEFEFLSDESCEFKEVHLRLNKTNIVVKYVHELQNLYFALTGSELTVA